MIFGNNGYKTKIELLCNRYEIPKALRRYFLSLPQSKQPKSFEDRKQVIGKVYSGRVRSNAIKCLEEIMKI